jgi:hypothetical protein
MGDVLPFKRPSLAARGKQRTLCKSGFHKWEVVTENRFDVKAGRLVTQYRCVRCGAEKTTAH